MKKIQQRERIASAIPTILAFVEARYQELGGVTFEVLEQSGSNVIREDIAPDDNGIAGLVALLDPRIPEIESAIQRIAEHLPVPPHMHLEDLIADLRVEASEAGAWIGILFGCRMAGFSKERTAEMGHALLMAILRQPRFEKKGGQDERA